MVASARIHPFVARRAMRALRANPDDTAQAIRVIGALSGNSNRRLFERFRRSRCGARILREKYDLQALMSDLERLRAMPEGSLGAAIAAFYDDEQLSAQGLAEAGDAAYREGGLARHEVSSDEERFGARVRDLHDVFHVLTGYGRDLRGESAVLAFTVPQTWNTGIAYLVLDVLWRIGWRSEEGRLIRDAFRRGRRAEWLIDQDWEMLFEMPLEDVRKELGLGHPPHYEPLRSAGAPEIAPS